MSRKYRVWCDSGANIHSCREEIITLDDMGFTEAEFDSLSDDERDDVMKDVAWGRLDWGYQEVVE